jgi:hypothetical protein
MHLARPPTAARPGTNVSRPRRAPRVCSAADKTICGPSGSGGAGGGAIDGPGPAIDGTIALDGPSSKGGAIDLASGGGAGGFGIDSGNAGAGGISGTGGIAAGGAASVDAIATGGADAPMATGGTSAGGATGFDARVLDGPADVPTVDAPGTCSTDKDCPAHSHFAWAIDARSAPATTIASVGPVQPARPAVFVSLAPQTRTARAPPRAATRRPINAWVVPSGSTVRARAKPAPPACVWQ